MSIVIAPHITSRYHRWTQWKTIGQTKSLILQYSDDGDKYTIWGYDGPEVHICQIWKGDLPYAVIEAGYDQIQNDVDKVDFETNYQPTANQAVVAPIDTILKSLDYIEQSNDSTEIPLGVDGIFTGAWVPSANCAMITITVYADQDSAVDGLKFQWSFNGILVDVSDDTFVLANRGRAFALTPRSRYFRVVYVNGSTAQNIFRLNVTSHMGGVGLITRPLEKWLDGGNFAQTVRAVLNAKKTDGNYFPCTLTDDNELKVLAKIATGGATQDVHPVDANSVNMDVARDVAYPAGTKGLLFGGIDQSGIVRFPTISHDTIDARDRLEVTGKFSISPPSPPPATNPVVIDASNPLDVASTHNTDYTIANGKTFNITQLAAGSEGDPNEKGSAVEAFYVDASSVEHLIDRIYLSGFTTALYPDTKKARDNTLMVGNGTTTKIRVRRRRLGGAALEIDAVVRGFEE